MQTETTQLNIAELRTLAKQFSDPYKFMGSVFQNCECEVIVIQTLHASLLNFDKHGEAFSFEGKGVRDGRRMDGTNNGQALDRLLAGGFLVGSKFNNRPTLVMTQRLVDLLKGHLAAKSA